MKIEVTIERWKAGKKSLPGRWAVHAQQTFSDMEAVGPWVEKQNGPREPQPGWAFRVAVLP